MRRSLKWVLMTLLVSVPTTGYLMTKLRAHEHCTSTHGEPCDRH